MTSRNFKHIFNKLKLDSSIDTITEESYNDLTEYSQNKLIISENKNDRDFHNNYLQTGRYCLEFNEIELIGCGGFGSVYKAISKMNGNLYAIKKIPAEDEKQCDEILKEMAIWTKLSTKYVVQYNSAWIELNNTRNLILLSEHTKALLRSNSYETEPKAIVCIQMELCYSTLKHIMQKINTELNQPKFEKSFKTLTPIGYYIACELFLELVECVQYLHSRDKPVIHRDLKPSNILITDGSNSRFVKIADFGLATMHLFDEQSHTTALGTQYYMAPEVKHSRNYNTKADMYSLGVILKELLSIKVEDKSVYENDPKSVRIKSHYISACILHHNLVASIPSHRPTCDFIINKRNLLSLSINELIKDESFDLCLNSDDSCDLFCAKFLRKRLNEQNTDTTKCVLINNDSYSDETKLYTTKKLEKIDISEFMINLLETLLMEETYELQENILSSKIEEEFSDEDNNTNVALTIEEGFKIEGLTNFNINKLNVLLGVENFKFELNGELCFPDLKINGKYKMNGKVFKYFPISGNGEMSIHLQNLKASFIIIATVKHNRYSVDLMDMKMSFSSINLYFENLYDSKMTQFFNNLLNFLAKPLIEKLLLRNKLKMNKVNDKIIDKIDRRLNKNPRFINNLLNAYRYKSK